MLTIMTVKFQTKIWLHILKKVLQWLWTIIHQVQIKIQSQQVYMIWKRRMAQQKSIYGNPQLFPSMLPWLFPYGLGGVGQTEHKHKLSSMMHKRHLLMYYDKRFQKDPHFPLIAFNHEQMKESTTAGYLTAERKSFHDITDRLMNVNLEVLSDLTKRMTKGERVKPETEEEKLCFKLINDLDHVNGHVPGSITQKKYMRNEIWSLISYFGAPSWFITFSPADNMHPISLYFADTQETFSPELRP